MLDEAILSTSFITGFLRAFKKKITFEFYLFIYLLAVCECILGLFNQVQLFATLWTIALPPPRLLWPWDCPGKHTEGSWSGSPRSLPGNLPDPGIESMPLMSPALVGGFFTTGATQEAPF